MAYIYSNWISHFVISNSRSQIAASNRLRTVGSFCRIRLRVFDPFGCFFGQCLFCRERRYDSFSGLGFDLAAGIPGDTSALCRHGTVRCGRPRFSLFRNFGGRRFGKHVEHQLQIGHVVAQAFGFQSLVLLVLARGHTRPAQRNNIGQRGVFLSLFDTAAFPFVGQFLAYLDGFQPLVDPVLGIAFAMVIPASGRCLVPGRRSPPAVRGQAKRATT